jgi:antitoxin component YwqK of YwqJK toxin-antitoxin module
MFKGAEQIFLDSVKNNSDSFYSKPYKPTEFAVAEYYVSRKDSTICQIMKGKDSSIRQVIITRKKMRIYAAEYFPNGQLKAKFTFNTVGNFEGRGIFYFENGCTRYSGNFHNGLYTGEWENFDSKGNLISTDIYDQNGQLEKTLIAH